VEGEKGSQKSQNHPKNKKVIFWNPGKFYRIIGYADTETVMQYVLDQRLEQISLDLLPTTANRAS